jgi:nucleotidyltransferase/DNA polymerase involved in DNA repair
MPFPLKERRILLTVPGVGPAVLQRLESVGIHSIADLSRMGADAVVRRVNAQLGMPAWENRRKALNAALRLAAASSHKLTEPTPDCGSR